MHNENNKWSSKLAFYFVSVGAAVGLGTLWRFPYLAGQYGGVFILVFIVVCLVVTAPILAAEFMLGRSGRGSPPAAVRTVALASGRSSRWSLTGWLGTLAIFAIMTYYAVIGGWVFAYVGTFATGELAGADAGVIGRRFQALLSSASTLALWHFLFLAAAVGISVAGLARGIELANKVMIPGLFVLLLALVVYAFAAGDLDRGAAFVFRADWSQLDGSLVLAAVGQAFYATGVGMAIMMAYGAYLPRRVSLLRSGAVVSGSIVAASILASLVVFPLAFRYGVDPAQGPELAFIVLPAIFAEMPGGQVAGLAFFLLLAFAALSSAIAGLEPPSLVLRERFGLSRHSAVAIVGVVLWLAGLPVVLSFNLWEDLRPLAAVPPLAGQGIFELLDYASANVLLPVSAFLTCLFVAWRLPVSFLEEQFGHAGPGLLAYRVVLGAVCPLAILLLFVLSL
ncbi:MAG TPA: sodium-dependent transporter [Woeseiaceae bacterium]|nr:sodium-dependent transporter [Woeseiaceae bacterium]